MLSKNLLEALNDQMNHEYFAAHAYMAMAAYCDKIVRRICKLLHSTS